MPKAIFPLVILLFISVYFSAQITVPELQKFSNANLFNTFDTLCFDVSGEWTGEEIQYDPTQSFIKVKFKVVFNLHQEGNRVYGTSYIEDKYRGSYGDMKIRGIVIGNKLHFEEYEINNEKIFKKNTVWCLRSGELTIKRLNSKIILDGLDYNGYASDNYSKCTDYVKMSLTKTMDLEINHKPFVNQIELPKKTLDIVLFPNPCSEQATLSYELEQGSNVQIAIFTLSGARMVNVLNTYQEKGVYKTPILLSSYAAGVYLVRFLADDLISTKQVVKTN